MQQLQSTTAATVWSYFLNICAIPHPSKHEQKLADWICDWAKQNNIACNQDEVGNLILRKPASSGHENKTATILQAHLDMVPQKNKQSEHNFLTDPIQPIIDGEWMQADNTTLGADNGIGIASCLAVLADNSIAHPPLEVLLTVDEETSMTGAFGLQAKSLHGKILINTDSEQEGALYVGCSGSVDLNITFPYVKIPSNPQHKAFEISLTGLKGGHSGRDINLQRGNALKILVDVLHNLDAIPFHLSIFEGGNLRNTIPREARAVIVCEEHYHHSLEVIISNLNISLNNKFHNIEESLLLAFSPCERPATVLSHRCQIDFLDCLKECENGVLEMDTHFPNVVQTSSNLGEIIQKTDDQARFILKLLVRSHIDSEKVMTVEKIAQPFKERGATYRIDGNYPSWKADLNAAIYNVVSEQYTTLFKQKPQTMIIHTGLECGLFNNKFPELDMISFGPTIKFPHTPGEKVHIPSVDKYWRLLTATLQSIE